MPIPELPARKVCAIARVSKFYALRNVFVDGTLVSTEMAMRFSGGVCTLASNSYRACPASAPVRQI